MELEPLDRLSEKIRARTATVGVAGLGYVGLPLLVTVAGAGFPAIGYDVDSDRVAMADESGASLSEEMMLPLLADFLLPQGTGKLVITNLSTTALLEDVAAQHHARGAGVWAAGSVGGNGDYLRDSARPGGTGRRARPRTPAQWSGACPHTQS